MIEVAGEAASGRDDRKLARALIERIGEEATCEIQLFGEKPARASAKIENHEQAVAYLIRELQGSHGLRNLDAVGHRVVHGGDRFTTSVLITDEVVAALDELTSLAPLHNPPSVSGIRAARAVLGPALPMVAVFDTSFHRTLTAEASSYALPYDLAERHKIKRYGFHGLAHHYSALRYGEITEAPIANSKIVTVHLGNGCSAAAIRGGESVDTSMGFTPLEGLVMGTRSGDLDAAIVTYLARQANLDIAEIENLLNQRSGLLGVSGLSNDMRRLLADYAVNSRARLAVDLFCYRARKYLGAYLAVLGGADAVIFSGGIGENSPLVREKISAGMEWLGLRLDPLKNAVAVGAEARISTDGCGIQAYVIPSDEEALIARETAKLAPR